MTGYDQIADHARQYCPGVSVHIITPYVNALVRDFIQRSWAWVMQFDGLAVPEQVNELIDISTLYAADLAALDVKFERVITLYGDGARIPATLFQQVRNKGISLTRTLPNESLSVKIAVRPDLNCTQLPDDVAEQHIDTLARGIAARILRIPNRSWTEPAYSEMYQQDYERECNTIRSSIVNDNNTSTTGKYNYWGGPVR